MAKGSSKVTVPHGQFGVVAPLAADAAHPEISGWYDDHLGVRGTIFANVCDQLLERSGLPTAFPVRHALCVHMRKPQGQLQILVDADGNESVAVYCPGRLRAHLLGLDRLPRPHGDDAPDSLQRVLDEAIKRLAGAYLQVPPDLVSLGRQRIDEALDPAVDSQGHRAGAGPAVPGARGEKSQPGCWRDVSIG